MAKAKSKNASIIEAELTHAYHAVENILTTCYPKM